MERLFAVMCGTAEGRTEQIARKIAEEASSEIKMMTDLTLRAEMDTEKAREIASEIRVWAEKAIYDAVLRVMAREAEKEE